MEDGCKKRARAMAWDPSNPAKLQLPSTTNGFRVDSTLSHDGVGCNAHETSALMQVLDARDAYKASTDEEEAAVAVSRAYRKALCDCVQGWETDLQPEGDDHTEEAPQQERENLDLLKITYAVVHLSETFLLTPNLAGAFYENPSSLPGAVTAETVRYLRLHHMSDPMSVCDEDLLEDLENSIQPDQIDGGEPYWKLLESFVVRGCLQDAWALLTRHSMHRQAQQALLLKIMDEYQAATLAQDQDGFRALEALLLSAPLPGGRTDEHDGDFFMQEEGTSDELLDGVPPLAFRLWEANKGNREVGDFPTSFQPNAALQVFNAWKRAVKTLPEVQLLKRRIPQLEKILAILTGDFSDVVFESWAEELCAELLYKAPDLRLNDMHVRASVAMQKHADETSGFFNEVVLSVMRGNSGRVIEVLHELGGGSGAALPAAMTSLLCSLLDDACIMPKLSTKYSIQTELLLSAAFAIRSSFATEGKPDIGTRLVVRLLIPHIKVEGDIAVTATMVNALEHHYPETDAEASILLDLCRKLVERKNVRVLDGCLSVCLARYRHFLSDERPGGAVHWLLTGMELEALCFAVPDPSSNSAVMAVSNGVAYRLLVTKCLHTTDLLLKGLLGEGEGVSLTFVCAKEIVAVCAESEIAVTIPEFKVLEHVTSMAEAIAERKDDALVATSIVACLEEREKDESSGVVSCLARPSMHWDLLRLTKVILDRNVEREAMEAMHLHAASFDVRGMQVLLEKLTLLLATHEMMGEQGPSPETIQQTRLAFAEGLMRAFVAENAMKQSSFKNVPSQTSLAGVYAADLGKVSREKQELVVQRMLDF